MSRLGKKIIQIPQKTTVTVNNGEVRVVGPQGESVRNFKNDIDIVVSEEGVKVTPKRQSKETAALWGTYVSHLKNMIEGVNTPFAKKLSVEGIGYRVELKGDKLQFALGFSHPVIVDIPKDLKVSVEKNIITVSGINKDRVGEYAAKLRDLKKPEPYKGKGIRYENEVIRMKQGKKSV